MDLFRSSLEMAINNQLSYQEQNYNCIELLEIPGSIIKTWQGKGQLLASSKIYSAWMYNKDNAIWIEITPSYPEQAISSQEG